MKLSILIPTLPGRERFFDNVYNCIMRQIEDTDNIDDIEVLDDRSPRSAYSIGIKRNLLMARAQGEYMAFIDDDDRIADNYIELVMGGIATNPDCCSLRGIITTNGANPKPFIHSIKYDSMWEDTEAYYRPPNHLNTIKTELARQCEFPDWQRSEDSNFCFQLRDKGLLKKEYVIEPVIYYYDYVSDKNY